MGGLYTALTVSKNPILLTSCDMPFITMEHIQYLIKQFDPNVAATIAVSKKGIEPLFGIYQHIVLQIIDELIASKEFTMYRIFDIIKVKFVDFENTGYISESFFNINTLSDYKKALYLGKKYKSIK